MENNQTSQTADITAEIVCDAAGISGGRLRCPAGIIAGES